MAQSSVSGGIDPRTFQPLRGHKKKGTLRIGEMEQDAFIAWGLSMGLHTRFLDDSDGCVLPFCRTCGLLATEIPQTVTDKVSRARCDGCQARAAKSGVRYVPAVAYTYIARSSLIVIFQLRCMGIALRMEFDD